MPDKNINELIEAIEVAANELLQAQTELYVNPALMSEDDVREFLSPFTMRFTEATSPSNVKRILDELKIKDERIVWLEKLVDTQQNILDQQG